MPAWLVFVFSSSQLEDFFFFNLSAWQKVQTVLKRFLLSTPFEFHGLFWNKCVDMCAVGAGAVVGETASGASQIQAVALAAAGLYV